jgi:hypothetical protein
MKKQILLTQLIFALLLSLSCARSRSVQTSGELSATFDKSLVYINASIDQYDGFQPWKRSPSADSVCYGTAVGPCQILTIAEPLANASLVQIKIHSSGQFIPAAIKVIDYDLNLCLLEISADSISTPLQTVIFTEEFKKGTELQGRWLSSDAAVKTSRGFLDRAMVLPSPTSYQRTLSFVVSNVSRQTSRGELYTSDGQAIGIAYSSSEQDVFLIPGEKILQFLKQANHKEYIGYGTTGFNYFEFLDPTVRKYLKMPEDMKDGCLVSSVYSKGTGSESLKFNDVLLEIDGYPINAFGRYQHPLYGEISFEHLLQRHVVGEPINFVVWRDGKRLELSAKSQRFESSEMLVPYQQYDKQPEYMVLGGYVFQKLTRNYLRLWGDNWSGKVPPHLLHYYRDLSLKSDEKRKDIVILSFVLPSEINLGYQNLGRIVVKTFNGMETNKISDLIKAQNLFPDSPFHVIEFEQEYPTLVIPKEKLSQTNQAIAELYGIQKTENIY